MNYIKVCDTYGKNEKILNPEEYIRYKILENKGNMKYYFPLSNFALITKELLREVAIKRYGIKNIKQGITKEKLLDLILEKEDIYTLANLFDIGVMSYDYRDAFDVSIEQVKDLEKKGFLKVIKDVSISRFKYATTYDVKQFADMTKEDLNKAIIKYNVPSKEYFMNRDPLTKGIYQMAEAMRKMKEEK